jgi:hypothetical protein
LTLANREFAQLPQNRDKLPGFRAIRGRLFFGFFLLAKQKKETRHRRNPGNAVRALKIANEPIGKIAKWAMALRLCAPTKCLMAQSRKTWAMPTGH